MMTLTAPDGSEVEAFISQGAGWVDTCIRATDKATWEAIALARNLLVETENGLQPASGAHIDHIGPVVLEPATYYSTGRLRKKAVMDNRHHLNLRIAEPLLSKTDDDGNVLWHLTAIIWMTKGADVAPNNAERAKEVYGVEMIDPESISKPARVWL